MRQHLLAVTPVGIRRPALTLTGRSSFAGPGVMTLEKLAPLNSF